MRVYPGDSDTLDFEDLRRRLTSAGLQVTLASREESAPRFAREDSEQPWQAVQVVVETAEDPAMGTIVHELVVWAGHTFTRGHDDRLGCRRGSPVAHILGSHGELLETVTLPLNTTTRQ